MIVITITTLIETLLIVGIISIVIDINNQLEINKLIKIRMKAIKVNREQASKCIDDLNKVLADKNITINEILQIQYDYKGYCNRIYLDELKNICDVYYLNFDEVKLFDTTGKYDIYKNMANGKTKEQRDRISYLHSLLLFIPVEVINTCIVENKGILSVDKDKVYNFYTDYTDNEKAFNNLNKIIKLMKDLNIKSSDIKLLIDNDSNINAQHFKEIF